MTFTRTQENDPRESVRRAWSILVNPQEYGKQDRHWLMERGIQHYVQGDDLNTDVLLKDISQYFADCLDWKMVNGDIIDHLPKLYEQPGRLALLMSFSSILVRRHQLIQEDPRKPIIHRHLREFGLETLFVSSKHSQQSDRILQEMGKVVYSRDQQDEYGPPVGRLIEDIVQPNGLSQLYYKMPLVHANRRCLARSDEQADGENSGSIQSLVKGKYVYVPVSSVYNRYRDYFTSRNGTVALLEEAIQQSLGGGKLDSYHSRLTGVNDRIQSLYNNGKDDILLKERRYPAKLEVILRSVNSAPGEIAKLGDPITAKEAYEAVKHHRKVTEVEWVKSVGQNMNSVQEIGQLLYGYSQDGDIPHVEEADVDSKTAHYHLEYKYGSVKKIDVESIGDVLELPCMQNLHDSLKEEKRGRWELYSFVRYLYEIDEADFDVDDIKDWFSQYPWYDEQTTEYQAGYEKKQGIKGDRPLPISCQNDNQNWCDHCIGKENCEYSLYRSIELKPDIFERIDDSKSKL